MTLSKRVENAYTAVFTLKERKKNLFKLIWYILRYHNNIL